MGGGGNKKKENKKKAESFNVASEWATTVLVGSGMSLRNSPQARLKRKGLRPFRGGKCNKRSTSMM